MGSDDVCKEVECGKGTCKPSKNSTFLFECECHQGWKQSLSNDDDESSLKFLPCIVPNCKQRTLFIMFTNHYHFVDLILTLPLTRKIIDELYLLT